MIKPFLTYSEQIRKLRDEKGLIIKDEAHAVEILTQAGYFSFINGYKTPFKDPATGKYKKGSTFEDIENLYLFDEALREVFFKYLLNVEQKLKSHISYYFSEEHGNSLEAYTNFFNYDYKDAKKAEEIFRLLGELNRVITANFKEVNLNHYILDHANIPLWVLTKKLTFGNISKMLNMFPAPLQTKISKNYVNLTSTSQLSVIISLLVLFRNTCAHNDRLYNYRVNKVKLPCLKLHKELRIPRFPNGDFACGQQDLFAAVIALRYLLDEKSFASFFQELQKLIQNHPNNSVFSKPELAGSMGFPQKWEEMAAFSLK
ncbi:MAG: Abi family protein [Treponema sp.]|nr:Abi family protein [Treponema sp.]